MARETYIKPLGVLREEDTRVMDMPRSDFLDLVDLTLARHKRDGILDETTAAALRAVAERMTSFPIHSWLTDSGCGCLTGEYLVEIGQLDRAAQQESRRQQRPTLVLDIVREHRDEQIVGLALDDAVMDYCARELHDQAGDWVDLVTLIGESEAISLLPQAVVFTEDGDDA